MKFSTQRISVFQDIESRWLNACYDGVFLWSRAVIDPGSTDEVAEIFTVTLVRFVDVLQSLSAHQRIELLAGKQRCHGPRQARRGRGVLRNYPDGE